MALSNKKLAGIISCLLILTVLLTAVISGFTAGAETERASYETTFAAGGFAHAEKFAAYDKSYIIDVSSYDTVTDWNAVYNAGIDGVIIRAGYRGYKTASFNQDSKFETFYAGAKAAGLKVGAYFYGQPISYADSTEEAKYLLGLIEGKTFELPVVYDIEYADKDGKATGRFYEANLSSAVLTSMVNNFCNLVKNAGYSPMLYTNANILTNKMMASLLNSPVWLARYNSVVDYNVDYVMWQYTAKGTVSGITTQTDVSVLYIEPQPGGGGVGPITTDEAEEPDTTETDTSDTETTITDVESTEEEPDEPTTDAPASPASSFFELIIEFFRMIIETIADLFATFA